MQWADIFFYTNNIKIKISLQHLHTAYFYESPFIFKLTNK